MRCARLNRLLAMLSPLLLCSVFTFAQTPGAIIQGNIVDGAGNAVQNALVQWRAVGVAGSATGSSDAQGAFSFDIPLARGSAQVQINVTANLYVPQQVSVTAQAGLTTPVQIALSLKPSTQLGSVSGTLADARTHKKIPAAQISILGAGAVLETVTNANGAFRFTGVGFNSNLTIEASTLEVPCIPTTDFPLSVSASSAKVTLTAQTLLVHTPHCPNNAGINHVSPQASSAPILPTAIDDTLQWKQADVFSIQTNANTNAWNAGHVNDILRGPAGTGLVVASDEGGVWTISENPARTAIPVSNKWKSITMTSLAYGVGGSSDVYAGSYNNLPSSPGGKLFETDTSKGFPLLNWLSVTPQPPCTSIERILVITEVQRIVLACDKGLVWSPIPPAPSVHGTYSWKFAQPSNLGKHAFSGLAKGTGWIPGSLNEGSISASWWAGTAPTQLIFEGAWTNGVLNLTPANVSAPANPAMGRTSLAACAGNPNVMFAVAADGSDSTMNAIWQSNTGGTSWNLVSLPANAGKQGSYNNSIAVSGDCSIVAVGWEGPPFVSYNNGSSWTQLNDGPGYNNLHPDVHALTFDPANPTTLFIGSDGGVASASNLGANNTPVFESDWSDELLNLEFNPGSASTSFAGLVTGALQDNGVVYADIPVGAWQHVTDCGCDGGQSLFVTPPGIAPGNDLLVEREFGFVNFPLSLVKTINGSLTFNSQSTIPVKNGAPSINDGIAQAVRSPGGYLNASGEPLIAVNGFQQGLFGLFSLPDGSDMHWESLGTIGGPQGITAVGPTANGSSVFVGTDRGNIYRFDAPYTGAALQLTVNSPEPGIGSVSGLFAFFSSVAWATFNINGHGYAMFWGNFSWDVTGGGTLPITLPFNSIAARDLNTIFVASSAAVYDTRNAGAGWSLSNVGLPTNITHNPQLYYLVPSSSSSSFLYLFTWGRSLWRTTVP